MLNSELPFTENAAQNAEKKTYFHSSLELQKKRSGFSFIWPFGKSVDWLQVWIMQDHAMLLRVPWASICGGSKPKHVKTQRLECRLKLKEVMLIMFTYPAHSDNLTPFPSCKAPLKSVAQPSSGALLQGFHVLEARDVPGFVDLNMVEVYFCHLIGSLEFRVFTGRLQETQNMFLPFDSICIIKLGGNNYP